MPGFGLLGSLASSFRSAMLSHNCHKVDLFLLCPPPPPRSAPPRTWQGARFEGCMLPKLASLIN